MRRILVAAVMGLMLTASSVFAADDEGVKAPRRPMLLPSLYAGAARLQGYDVYSTLTALKSGATEANPLMKGITKSPAAFVVLKAGVTMASIMTAERMWKNNRRVAAVMLMVVSNGMLAAVAAHNASTLRRVQ